MKVREIVLSLVLAATAGSLLFFSCGKGSGDPEEPAEQSSEGKDVTQPFVLNIASGEVAVPAGAFAEGSKFVVKAAAVPAEFQTDADVSLASQVIELAATDDSGAPILEAKQPLTVALDLNAAAALDAIEKKNENLCVLNMGIDKVLRIWRYSQLTVTADQVKFAGIWMGYYAALYCGAEAFADVKVVNATGTGSTAPAGAAGEANFSCDYKAAEGVGYCAYYVGSIYGNADIKAKTKEACETAKGTFGDSTCAEAAVAGVCVYQHGTVAEFAWSYYTDELQQGQTAESIRTTCEKQTGAKWFEAGAYTPTPVEGQKAVSTDTKTATNTSTATEPSTPTTTTTTTTTSTNTGTTEPCLAVGSCVKDQYHCFAGSNSTHCAGLTPSPGTFDPDGVCPTVGRVGCCQNMTGGFSQAFYAPMDEVDSATACTSGTLVMDGE